jgi:hypothetical protein
LNTIALGYTLPKQLVERAQIQSLKVYVNATNPFVFAPDWTYWDPEYRNRASDGAISTAIAPTYYSLGLNVTF